MNYKLDSQPCYSRRIDGVKCEPIEDMVIDLPESKSGSAVELATKRKGELVNMTPKGDRMILNFRIPSRGIIGLRNSHADSHCW